MDESLRSKVEEHLTCSVCLEPLKDPKVLPCLHTYCHDCLVRLAQKAESDTINCPECRFTVKVDEKTVSTLPSNFFVNNLLATIALTNEEPAAKKIVCDNCDNEDAAQSRCNECGMFLCQLCTDSHKRYRSTKLHKLLTMDELKSNLGPRSIAEKIRCSKHKDEVIKLFCKTCQTTICRDCTIVDHRKHEYGFVEEVAEEEKQNLQRNLNEVKQRKVKVAQGIVDLRKLNESFEAKKKSTISEINSHFDELARAVESRKNEMVEKATSLTNSKQKQTHDQLEVLEVALASCESSIEFTERAFENGNDVQILSMEKYILHSLEQLKNVKDQTEPCVSDGMGFVIPSLVAGTQEKLFNEYDIDVNATSPGNCTTSFKETETIMKAGNRYSITLICNDKDNRRMRFGGQVIKPSFTGVDVSEVVVTDNKDGSYNISFTPRQNGMLKFEVAIDGMPALNCSLTKQVKWFISDVHGRGPISNDGITMTGEHGRGQLSCRVGGCYFESGVHTWKVRLCYLNAESSAKVEVGIIDYEEINADMAKSNKKWSAPFFVPSYPSVHVSLTVDMDNKTLNITSSQDVVSNNFKFTACRVSPFFAFRSRFVTLTVVQLL